MPRGCGSGSMGSGARAGRGGGGGGRGWRHGFSATGLSGWMRGLQNALPAETPDTESEQLALKNQVRALQAELDVVNRRLQELTASAKTE